MKMKNRVLAVLALALLMINMAPVMKAEAAVAVPDPDSLSFKSDDVRAKVAEYLPFSEHFEYLIVVSLGDGLSTYYLYDQKPELYLQNGLLCLRHSVYQGIELTLGVNNNQIIGSVFRTGSTLMRTEYNYDDCVFVGSNFDTGVAGFEGNNLQFGKEPEPVFDYIYSSSGPVAATWSAGISNLMRFVPAGADDIDDFYVQSNWAAQFDKWKYTIIYRVQGELPALAGSSPTDGNMYKLYTESVIAFPSKDVVTGWISSGMSPVECYFEKGQTNWRNTVYDGKNTFVKVKVTNESIPSYHSLMNGSHAFQVDIPMQDVIAAVDESFDGGLRGYYGLSQEMWDMWKYSIFEYKVPYEIYTVLYAKEDVDTMVYGNMHYSVPNWTNIDPLSQGYVFTGGVIEKPLEDITDNDKQEIQIDTTREELAKRTEELEQLKKEYAESLKMNGSDEDVFELFSNFTAGLRSSSNSFKNVATAVGNVFAFFPQDITGLLYGGIIVMIVVAIYKALRG